MRLPKATLRKNGKHMVTFNVTYHLYPEYMFVVMLIAFMPGSSDWPRTKVVNTVKNDLRGNGMSDLEPDRYLPSDEYDDAAKWARRQLERTFPEVSAKVWDKAVEDWRPVKDDQWGISTDGEE